MFYKNRLMLNLYDYDFLTFIFEKILQPVIGPSTEASLLNDSFTRRIIMPAFQVCHKKGCNAYGLPASGQSIPMHLLEVRHYQP